MKYNLFLFCINLYSSSYSNLFYLVLIICSHILFISIFSLLNRSPNPNVLTVYLSHLILQCSSISIILTSSYKYRWFHFSFHIWSAILLFDFTSTWITFSLRYSSPLYTLPQLHAMEYTKYLINLHTLEGLTWKRNFRRVIPLLNIVLISFGL